MMNVNIWRIINKVLSKSIDDLRSVSDERIIQNMLKINPLRSTLFSDQIRLEILVCCLVRWHVKEVEAFTVFVGAY